MRPSVGEEWRLVNLGPILSTIESPRAVDRVAESIRLIDLGSALALTHCVKWA